MTKRTALLFIISLCTFITSAQVTTNLYKQSDQKAVDHWVDSIYSTMSLDEKIGQLFMPIVESRNDWKPRIAGYIQNQKVGGLLFSKGTLSQQASITNYAQELSKVPLFISLDGEWGLSMRIQDAPSFPRNMIIGAIQDEKIVELYGSEVARQCKEMGIHINFAPVIDVHSNPANPIIGNRSFGENPDNVSRKGIAYAMGLESNGVISVAKHFPGHGDTSEDSHKTLPVITHNKARIEQF